MTPASEPNPTVPHMPPAFSWWRCFRFPLVVVVLFAGLFAIPWVCFALNADWLPLEFVMVSQWHGPALAILLIGIWWLFFAAFPWMLRFGVFLAVIVIAAAGTFFCVRDVELTMGRVSLVPRFQFAWEPSTSQKVAEFIRDQPSAPPEEVYAYVGPHDYPRYRGANSDGIVPWAKLETDWAKSPPTALWDHACGNGYSGVAVAGNIAVTLEQRDDAESIVCYDKNSGRQLWAYANIAHYKDATKMGDGPRSTPTIHVGQVYSIGATGEFVCLDTNGKRKWSTNVLDDARAKNIKWGLTGSPLIVDDLVIAHAGIDDEAPADSALIAYEQANGTIRWRTGNRGAGYSSPQLATIGGKSQILLFDAAGLVSYEPKTGKELWQYPWVTDFNMNSIQPVVVGSDRVFISSEIKNGAALLRVKPPESAKASWTTELLWHNKNLAARYANPVTDGKSIYGLHNFNGILTCLDVETGNVKWKGEREGPGQLLLAENALIVVNGDTGDVALFELDVGACRELGRYRTFERPDKTWNTPALAGDQLFVRNQAHIACIKLPQR